MDAVEQFIEDLALAVAIHYEWKPFETKAGKLGAVDPVANQRVYGDKARRKLMPAMKKRRSIGGRGAAGAMVYEAGQACVPGERADLTNCIPKLAEPMRPQGTPRQEPAAQTDPMQSVLTEPNPQTGIPDKARVGVPGMSVPPPPQEIPRLPNLSKKQRKVETAYAEAYLADPDGMAFKYLRALNRRKVGEYPNVFATDDVKMLNRDFNPGKARVGDKLDEDTRAAMAKYNAAIHQTANAIAKRAFLMHLDTLKPGTPVLVTNGGCAAGKGSTLKRAQTPGDPHAGMMPAAEQVGAIWDAAGEQNATENEWVLQECAKRGLNPVFAYVWADPRDTWSHPERGVIRRAIRKGRMVDARLFADSYALGARNMHAFVQKHPDANFIFIDNRNKQAPKVLDRFPEETLQWNSDAIYQSALAALAERKDELDKALLQGGLVGTKIWGRPNAA